MERELRGSGAALASRSRAAPGPWWRNERALRVLFQVLFLAAVALAAGALYANMLRGLDRLGLTLNVGFLDQEAGFGISEGIAYAPSDTYGRAFVLGAVNTLRVSGLGIAMATVLGLVAGVARLSGNWLVRQLSGLYVEVFRNTPVLLQLLFWYAAVMLSMPPVRRSLHLGDLIFITQRGVYLARAHATGSSLSWLALVGGAALMGTAVGGLTRMLREEPRGPWRYLPWMGALLGAAAGWALARWLLAAPPLVLEVPRLQGFNFRGGIHGSPEFTALLLGLVVYTGAFIAEVVRAGVLAVGKGQREAAEALGLSRFQVMRVVILPQALRVIIPPLTSQYLNLAKNSSLAIAIGFPDLFNVGNTMLNQTGQSIPVFGLIMASYLAMSLFTSLLMNLYNRRVKLVER
ncbi:amino acid ABC transporter permease [Limnochorda pilosa]|uniref:Polar amino acid ABC transporter permease n=1 Tax=Limnochorda pilosa TaxID=1555112 RepID=A0A0K2SHL9_LIMPI|nr:ABC transporter permease subunit [Limnochorda pilosa]BAS26532.1 polar amino acid ABC transporter permease [Limnochorda pilosa]